MVTTAMVRQKSRFNLSTSRPVSTYRLQLHHAFTFKDALRILPQLKALGVHTLYLSPIFKASPGSVHGYDVVDHSQLNPELGTPEDFQRLARDAHRRKMGLILDIVPNHMCIGVSDNRWWQDVLENGAGAKHAHYFDIDWQPPKRELANKVLLPFLGDQYGKVLESGDIRVVYDSGAFWTLCYKQRYPLAPRSWKKILQPMLPFLSLRATTAARLELESIITALDHFPSADDVNPDRVEERYREREIIRRRLAGVLEQPSVKPALKATLDALNGSEGIPKSFDALEDLLAEQPYRLSYWRVAADEINYRRFFDIKELAAIRVEEPAVFEAVHRLPLALVRRGWVTGLRIDHVDGLYDPFSYLVSLQNHAGARTKREVFILVEKILSAREKLKKDWPIHGTTGYDFTNVLNGVFVMSEHAGPLRRLYGRFTEQSTSFADTVVTSKKLIMLVSLASELRVLAHMLDRVSEQHRWSRDFTQESLRFALREVIACFPVYRSYIRLGQSVVDASDRNVIETAIADAKRRNPATEESIFDFIGEVLLLKDPDGLTEKQISKRRHFVLRVQQMTGPTMAKGLEDTAFFRYFPLSSLNEVGGDPDNFGTTLAQFHGAMAERQKAWPLSLSATSTHDTKRSEDVRARINVLSEMPAAWYRAIRRWQTLNASKKRTVAGRTAPDSNEEYLLYQTLIGTWPLKRPTVEERRVYVRRIQQFMVKALKEAKQHTSWIKPNVAYEEAVTEFVASVLENGPENDFIIDFEHFQRPVTRAGLWNALSQVFLKVTLPGVPDFYQGTEVWNFSLVDPDNRRPVDHKAIAKLRATVERIRPSAAPQLLNHPEDGAVKMYVTQKSLEVRNRESTLFLDGKYHSLQSKGFFDSHVISFARELDNRAVIGVATRFHWTRGTDTPWKDVSVRLPNGPSAASYRDAFTGTIVKRERHENGWSLPLDGLLNRFPVALLEPIARRRP
jgi:(1->4)-alpha-D-glucan 1-alpha-D-glucosylmutase